MNVVITILIVMVTLEGCALAWLILSLGEQHRQVERLRREIGGAFNALASRVELGLRAVRSTALSCIADAPAPAAPAAPPAPPAPPAEPEVTRVETPVSRTGTLVSASSAPPPRRTRTGTLVGVSPLALGAAAAPAPLVELPEDDDQVNTRPFARGDLEALARAGAAVERSS